MISRSPESKIKTLHGMQLKLKDERRKKRKVVAMSGSMDLLHAGHVWALEESKKQGDILIVLINSDTSVKMYKGPNRPIVPEKDRAMMVASLECVDYVVLFNEINPIAALHTIQPDVYCNSSEWGKDCVERNVVESYGGIVRVLPRTGGPSTTDILNRLTSTYKEKDVHAVFLDRDGTINDNKDGYIHLREDFVFLPGVLSALKKLSKTSYVLFIVTNQSGIGRGYYTKHTVEKLHVWIKKELKKHGVTINEIYYCPHRPEDGCTCRKPGYGLLLQAVQEYGVNLSKSWVVGDQWSDIAMGRMANVRTVKIGSKKRELGITTRAHFHVQNLKEAVDIITKK